MAARETIFDFVDPAIGTPSTHFCVGLYFMFAKNSNVEDVRFCFMSIFYKESRENQSRNPLVDG